ncbi:hypothetical protein ES288_D02G282300v1, partial [Gossypium darwinii]
RSNAGSKPVVLCKGGLCCSKWGWCGSTDDYCLKEKCQSNCTRNDIGSGGGGGGSGGDGGALGDILSRELFEEMLSHRNDPRCPAANFYTYDAFIAAAKLYPDFAAKGNNDTRKMEVAAFLGQTSHQTNGFGGYCYNEALNCSASYCENKPNYPCYAGVSYCGRGPMQLSWNYNYGQFGESIGQKEELLQQLKTDVTLSFMSALWFWMTAQPPKPSCHSVMTGEWIPSEDDVAAGRLPGYGVTTNIINGGLECGRGPDSRVDDRIKFYETYCDILGVSYGLNLDCYYQRPFNLGFLVESI